MPFLLALTFNVASLPPTSSNFTLEICNSVLLALAVKKQKKVEKISDSKQTYN